MTVSTRPFIAEGVAFDRGGRPLVSAVLARTIVRIERGRPRPWLRPGRLAPVGALFGMAADPARDRLWVAETFGGGLPGQVGPARTGLLEVELSSGRLLARHSAPEDGRKRMLSDLALGKDGTFEPSTCTRLRVRPAVLSDVKRNATKIAPDPRETARLEHPEQKG